MHTCSWALLLLEWVVLPAVAIDNLAVVLPNGPPGKTGWPDEKSGTIRARFHDAHIGMVRLLSDGYVNAEKYQAAVNVVQFVGTAFGKDEGNEFSDLMNKLLGTKHLEPLQFRTILFDWVAQFGSHWSFCKTKTCAVWQLFHSISALIAIGYAPITVAEALPRFRFMVDHFMDCEVCRSHFLKSYDGCEFGRCQVLTGSNEAARAKALVIWLWRIHNAINVHVIKEYPPPGDVIDRRWPAYHDCHECWKNSVVNGHPVSNMTVQDSAAYVYDTYNVFNKDAVFAFILMEYLGQKPGSSQASLFEIQALAANQVVPATRYMTMAFICAIAGTVVACIAMRRHRAGAKEIDSAEPLTDEELMSWTPRSQ